MPPQKSSSPCACVADALSTKLIRLPSWFTAGQAARVAELRGVDHVLVEEQGRVRGYVTCLALSREAPARPLARSIQHTDLVVSPGLSARDAVALMKGAAVSCLPVVKGGMLVGTVSLPDLESLLEGAPTAAHAA